MAFQLFGLRQAGAFSAPGKSEQSASQQRRQIQKPSRTLQRDYNQQIEFADDSWLKASLQVNQMKNKRLLIGATVLATIAVAGASAWMVNAGFISSPATPDAGTTIATAAIVPDGPLPLLGAYPDSPPVSTEWVAPYPAGTGFCDAAKIPANFPDPSKILLPGKDGWVFRQDELQWPSKPVDPALHRAVQALQKYLKSSNTKLIVLISPPRNITGARHVDAAATPYIGADHTTKMYRNLLAELRKDGAYVPDILAEADFNRVEWDQLSDPADSHWSALGAKMAADATARIIQAEGRSANTALSKFKIERNGGTETVSDYLDILANICGSSSLSKDVATFGEAKADAPPNAVVSKNQSGSIVLTGTSFTARDRRYNYSGFLSEGTGQRIANLSSEGSNPVQSLAGYLASGALLRERPRFLVWEMTPQNLPDSNSAAQIEAYVDPNCSVLGETVTNFDWNEARLFGSDILRTYTGTRAKLVFSTNAKSLHEFKIITQYHDGRTDQLSIDFVRSKIVPDQFRITIPNIVGAKSISIKPVGMTTGKIKAQLCSMDV